MTPLSPLECKRGQGGLRSHSQPASRTLALLGMAALWGCAGWPRFAAEPDDDDAVPASGRPVELLFGPSEADTDFPNSPAGETHDGGALREGYRGLAWVGWLDWAPIGEPEPSCPVDFGCLEQPLPERYTGDIDFFRFSHDGGALCVTVATHLEGDGALCDAPDPVWEMPLFPVRDGTPAAPPPGCEAFAGPVADACVGEWLNDTQGSGSRAYPVVPSSGGLFFASLEAGEYSAMIAPVCGVYFTGAPAAPNSTPTGDTAAQAATVPPSQEVASEVPYIFAAAVVPSQKACDELNTQVRSQVAERIELVLQERKR